ncbi:hybrid sensor histidine kinase/response regulator [Paractinoplanes atraurantiacus]|uniref:hybrid sensor histidine kinase/response regulator n=1 Tax=Paractinoplanes atraurantiacus TaxID=1036182 RepID=UPI0015CF7C3C|nr:ATP-binding protein [Actinoplanes atraurantiacus]
MALVVVAEDNLDHQRVIAQVIRRLGHEVVVAGDGRAGLAAVAEHRPALLVADVDMPEMDGLELCRSLRADPALAGTPVVLITAYLLPGDQRLQGVGALDVIGKPFGVPELSQRLGLILDNLDKADDVTVKALLGTLDAGVVICDVTGRVTYGNAELPAAYEQILARALAGERLRGIEVIDRDRWYAVNAAPIIAADGATTGAVAAFHDRTYEHRSREYQQCETEVLRVLADHTHAIDATDRILHAIGSTLGWPYVRLWLVDEVTDVLRPAGNYTAPGERSLPTPASMSRGSGLAGSCWAKVESLWVPDIHARDSPVLPYVSSETAFQAGGAVPVRSGDRVIGVLSFFTYARQEPDPALTVLLTGVAGLIGAFLEQRRAEVLALHLAAATDEYIALVGHELRTPLTSIGAYVDLIAESPDETPMGEVREMLDVVQRNNVRLRDLVEKLLDLAALESGHAQLTIVPVDLSAVITEAVEAIAPSAAERRITIEAALPGELIVPGDRERLRQVADALLGNAVKFSGSDSTVTVALTDEHGDAVVLTVADQGVGVAPSEQARLFRRLYRGGNARHTGIPGAGLGLALCRVVVERHHGSITLASQEAAGTKVTVRLPCHRD